jgi:signal peptidase I
MTLTPDEGAGSPWITVWFSPRLTIERLIAGRASHLVWLLATLGMIATIYQQATFIDVDDLFQDGHFAIGLLLLGTVAGIIWLYLYAIILGWIGRCLGGEATALQIRTVFAWSMLPVIVSSAVVLGIRAAMEPGEIVSGATIALILIFTVWSFAIFLLMLGRVERFGFWRTIFTYLIAAVFLAIGVALFVRSLVYQSFNVPSGSMRPTLVIGDYFFVSKFAYGYSHFSLPF